MKSNLNQSAYTCSKWFEKERRLLFKPLWQFAGLKMILSKENAFLTLNVFGMPVVVQNFSGEIRAFENTCLHRQKKLQEDDFGVRPLICSYHGWSYGHDGAVLNIPYEKEFFQYSDLERKCLKLREFKLRIIGNLIFINLSENPIAIEDQFSEECINSLTEVSSSFDDEVLVATMPGRYNWKLIYENLRDSHHPKYLHARSLAKLVKFPTVVDQELVARAKELRGGPNRENLLANLRLLSGGGLDAPMEYLADFPWHENVIRYRDDDWYYNWLLYPNLHIASGTGGYSFIIEHHVPISESSTDLKIYFVTAKKRKPYSSSAAVLQAHLQGAQRVLAEDISALENIQNGFHDDSIQANLGAFEALNFQIEKSYLDILEEKVVL